MPLEEQILMRSWTFDDATNENYGRVIDVTVVHKGICLKCGKRGLTLYVDPSEGEYTAPGFCEECIHEFFHGAKDEPDT